MTAPDPVREALIEAGKAVRLRARFSPLTGQALSEDFAAHAIAAFLRAYAASVDPRCIAGEWFPRFAAAVERASKDLPHA